MKVAAVNSTEHTQNVG